MDIIGKKVYKFWMNVPFTFFKAGQYSANAGWKHKDIINDGDYELFIVLTGVAYIQIGSERFQLKKHDCLLIPPHVRHVGYQESPDNTNYYWLHFYSSGPVQSSYDSHIDKQKVEVIVPQIFNILNFDRVTILIRQLLDAANERLVVSFTTNYFVSSIVIELCNQYLSQIKGNESELHSTRFELIKNWIRIHSHDDLTVYLVAEHFDITPAYLTRLFKKYEGITTVQFINRAKIQQAKELLLTTEMSIKQIALELGFQSEKYFFRLFKHETQVTPTQFRNSFDKTYLNNLAVDPPIAKPNQIWKNKD
ncbi:transcriptional regulator, AraC family [Lentilactobacillus kisonensis DSM 19906 = JCM 15041]|uniref:Transcriptional regulator, AraC family n=1 Tax=Lentilactobacillus kisonensis DSM 19906 = JCM 15041 TaxID=1423766 RepID=A0A0R1NKJ9_9LACO|nr:transcriptional regulator, AraC family [Lentilactobacillus kisonensis DSM 19906 = JCM 15041]